MAVKPNNEENLNTTVEPAVSAEALKKTNNLVAVAVGLAGASILLTAGTAFAGTFDHKGPEDRGGYSQSQQGPQGGNMQGQSGEGMQHGKHGGRDGGRMQHRNMEGVEAATGDTDVDAFMEQMHEKMQSKTSTNGN